MTDRENSSGRFLQRWSRRKIEAERQTPDDAREDVAPRAPAGPTEQPAASATETPTQPVRITKAPPEAKPTFDLSSLPSLDSITAATDVRAFLTPGVPAELTRAALRRAWTADPAIRDFKGLAENDWDFTDPNAMPGFADLPADYDLKKVIAQIFGETDNAGDPAAAAERERIVNAPQTSDQPEQISAAEAPPAVVEDPAAVEPTRPEQVASQKVDIVHRNTNTAMHNSNSIDEQEETKTRRTHGRALPQ